LTKIILKNRKKLNKIEKHWETLRHWKHWAIFQYNDSETLNSIQCQCWKLKHWKPTQCQCQRQFFQCFNVSLNVQCQFADPYYKHRTESKLLSMEGMGSIILWRVYKIIRVGVLSMEDTSPTWTLAWPCIWVEISRHTRKKYFFMSIFMMWVLQWK